MRFNLKLVEYPSTATISVFNEDVGMDDGFEKKQQAEENLSYNPFTEKYEHIETFEDDIDIFKRRQDSLEHSVRRSRRTVLQLMRSLDLADSYFITLTFDKKKVDRTDFSLCCRKARNWLQNIRRYDGAADMAYICVPELHKDMASWHFHAVVSNPGSIPLADSGHKDRKGHTIYNLSGWQYGFSTAVKLNGEDPLTSIRLSKYMTKYLTKESQMIAKNKHRFFASQNIPKPIVHTWHYETEKDKQQLLQQIKEKGYEFISENTFDGYVKATYIETIKI